jgi:hypothetical protein
MVAHLSLVETKSMRASQHLCSFDIQSLHHSTTAKIEKSWPPNKAFGFQFPGVAEFGIP